MTPCRTPEAAFMLATLFKMVGGAFVIDSNGERHLISDLDAVGDRLRVSVMVEGMLGLLHPADKEFIFDALAECAIDPDSITAIADDPMRRAA